MTDDDLPGFWRDADKASKRAQNSVSVYSATRLLGSVLAAVGGAVSVSAGQFDLAAVAILVGFTAAFAAELASWIHKPERTWYDGRALAESAKTLAWRYAIGADPFPVTMPDAEARELLRNRLTEVSSETSAEIVVGAENPVVTPGMQQLRRQAYHARRSAYIEDRTLDQQGWYAKNARWNGRCSTGFRIALVLGELAAIVTAAFRVFGGWHVDLAGVMAAFIAAGAAWVGVKQFAPLAAAYSVAAKELALQVDRLGFVSELDWPEVAADAEEAISREHTLWLASRTGKTAIS